MPSCFSLCPSEPESSPSPFILQKNVSERFCSPERAWVRERPWCEKPQKTNHGNEASSKGQAFYIATASGDESGRDELEKCFNIKHSFGKSHLVRANDPRSGSRHCFPCNHINSHHPTLRLLAGTLSIRQDRKWQLRKVHDADFKLRIFLYFILFFWKKGRAGGREKHRQVACHPDQESNW